MSSYAKNCIFCDASPTTKEDVWPTWLTQHIPRSLNSYHGAIAEINPDGEIVKSQKKWDGDPRSRRARCVCRKCNNEWMGRLQEKAKPLLLKLVKGEEIRLTVYDQRLLATWATMTTMTSEYIQPLTVAVSARDRERFYKNRNPLKLWRIWIGNFHRGDWKPYRVHHAWPVKTRVRSNSEFSANAPPNTQTTTIVFGALYLHVASSDVPDAIRRMTFPHEVTDMILKQIWPSRFGTLRWPPRRTMPDTDADNATGFLFLSMTDLLWKKPQLKI
jgi:hypothetical protein